MTHCLIVKKVSLDFWKRIMVMFKLVHDFTHLASKWVFRTFAFYIKRVEILHASLYQWSLKNKLTLDLSRYIGKRLVGDTSCCNFFIVKIY